MLTTILSTATEVREFVQRKVCETRELAHSWRISPTLLRLYLLERRLVESHTTVIIPFDNRVIFVRLLNYAEFSSRLSKVAQTLDAISGIHFLLGGGGLGERWPLGTV